MKFKRYKRPESFRIDVLGTLLEDEVYNNLPVSIISGTSSDAAADWFMGTVTGTFGNILLVALCTKPFNLLLYTPKGVDDDTAQEAVYLLACELSRINFNPPGIMTETKLARIFTQAYAENLNISCDSAVDGSKTRAMILMRLDMLKPYNKAPGRCRVLCEDDLSFVPFWEQAFCIDCRVPAFPLDENRQRIRTRIGRDIHYIWEDGLPVSQAVFGRETPGGAVINWVYTPPLYRGRGYATAVVGELSKSLFKRGKKFCCLFADAGNPVSRKIYSNLGFYDVCEFTEIYYKYS